jgi:hypothetical protein
MRLIHTHSAKVVYVSSVQVMFWLCSSSSGNFNIHSPLVFSEGSFLFSARIILKQL